MAGKARVLVTRPEPGATETAGRLEAMGFLPIALPLHEIRPLPVDAGAVPDDASAVAITSANAIRHAPSALVERLRHLPCFAVGASTTEAAIAAGFSNVIDGGGDAEALAETVLGQCPVGLLAYLCGRIRRPVFEKRLAGGAIVVHVLETYDTVGLSHSTEEVLNLTTRHRIDYALVYSANAADVLAATMRQPGLEYLFENTIFACISGRVAEAFGGWPHDRIRTAAKPDEPALLSILLHGPGAAS